MRRRVGAGLVRRVEGREGSSHHTRRTEVRAALLPSYSSFMFFNCSENYITESTEFIENNISP